MGERSYSENIAEMIKSIITGNGWEYDFDEYKGLFTFVMDVEGKADKLDYLIKVGKRDYLIYVISSLMPNTANKRVMSALAECICHINYRLEEGSFQLNMTEGMVQFKYYVNCMGITPPEEIAEHTIFWPMKIFGRYLDGFSEIISGNFNISEVVDQCETTFIEKILSDYKKKIYAEMYNEDDYFYDAGEDISMEADLDFDDNVYYDYENVDRFLEWCVSREEDESPYFEVNMDLFREEEDE